MATLYTSACLLSPESPVREGCAILEEQGRIRAVGPLRALRREAPAAQIVDFGDAVILPAFINAHTHLELSLYPAWATAAGVGSGPCSFVDWILRLIMVKRSIRPAAMSDAITAGIRQCLEAGTAAVGDILSWFDGCTAYRNSPLRGRIFLETLGQDPDFTAQSYAKLDDILQEQGVAGLEFGLSPHSPYTIHPEYMSRLFARCRAEQRACATHIAESPAELDFLDTGDGELVERLYTAVNWHRYRPPARSQRPIDYLASHGGLFPKHLLVHGVQLNAREIETIARAGAHLVLCPRSNAHLQVGTAPVAKLKQAGIMLALGTDSLASNQSLSLWDELAFAGEVYADTFSAAELFALATSGGARVLGLQQELGALTPGRRCSFQVVRPHELGQPAQLLEKLIAAGRAQQVETLVLDGVSVL